VIVNSETAEALSWVIGLGNPLTALAIGPTVVTFWGPSPSERVIKIGWITLFATQLTFLAFGFASGYMAFKVAQPLMIPISGWNYYLMVNPRFIARRERLRLESHGT
jgi:hypothetical protein